MPGGCNFGGTRPIDQHVKGFAAMGATVREGDYICAAAEGGRMKGANIYLDVVSVGATVTVPSSQTWVCGPVAGMTSVLVWPQTVQV